MTGSIDPVLLRPRYTLSGASTILGISPATMHAWTRQRTYRGADGSQRGSVALVTTVDAVGGLTVPFLGLVEAYVLATFATAGLSLVRLRPALSYLARELVPVLPLTSEALPIRGPEVLHRYEDPATFAPLLAAAADPPRFREPVTRLLAGIVYRDGRAAALELPSRSPAIALDPRRDDGRPTLARSGVGVTDVITRLAAGQPAEQVARETGADVDDVRLLRR